ncbi:putative holin-like toxin [Bacillus haynesii]|nr:putative holin-like toxin [Bacillus haynesii]
MTSFQAISIMIAFGSFNLNLISLFVALLALFKTVNDKGDYLGTVCENCRDSHPQKIAPK